MNRGLLVFSILVIVVGYIADYYALSLIGALFLVPALLTTPKKKTPDLPTGSAQRPTPRVSQPSHAASVPRPQAAMQTAAATPETSGQSYAFPGVPSASVAQYGMQPFSSGSALFPAPMFPTLPQQASAPPKAEEPTKKQPGTDEVLEVGLIFAFLKLLAA